MKRRGVTMLELLVVMGMLAILLGVAVTSYVKFVDSAQRAKTNELLSQAATALTAVFEMDGSWPKKIRTSAVGQDPRLDAEVSYILASRHYLSMSYNDWNRKTTGLDKFGVITPWATDRIKHMKNSTLTSPVNSKSIVQDHIFRFAVDLDADGIVNATVQGQALNIRSTVAVWCCGKEGWPTPNQYKYNQNNGCFYSWAPGMAKDIQ